MTARPYDERGPAYARTSQPASGVGRGSDDEYCSGGGLDEGHNYASIRVFAPPIDWVEQCMLCRHISSRALRRQLAAPPPPPAPPQDPAPQRGPVY